MSTPISFDTAAANVIREIILSREEVLRAFVAKHGFEPERTVQITQSTRDGGTQWFIRRMTDEEMTEASRAGSCL
jgi:hypothetical protein